MSNGIASGVPPAEGGAGGVAGAGVCASADEPSAATAKAASVIETIERITILLVEIFVFLSATDVASHRRRQSVLAVGNARGLHRAVSGLFAGADENLGTRLEIALVAHDVGHDRGFGGHKQLLLAILVFDGQRRSLDAID